MTRPKTRLSVTQLELRDVPSASPLDPSVLSPGSSVPAAVVSSANSGPVAQQQQERITEAVIDFTKLPPAGTGYTVKITVTGATNPGAVATVTVDNTQGANDPKDTRDAVASALRQGKWIVQEVGDTKLRIKYWDRPAGGGLPATSDYIKDVEIEAKNLKDGQKPTRSFTRVSVPPGTGMSGTVGGAWTFGFAANPDAGVLPDDVLMTIQLTGTSGTSTVEVILTEGMTPTDAAQEVANALTAAGLASFVTGSTVQYDDPAGDLDSVEVEYNSLGASPVVDWLTETVGFNPTA